MEGNNTKAMREAVLAIKEDILKRRSEYQWYISDSEALKKIDAALSAPPRNCDVGTAEEQEERFETFCNNHFSNPLECGCEDCPCRIHNRCEFRWAQMPYDESEAK